MNKAVVVRPAWMAAAQGFGRPSDSPEREEKGPDAPCFPVPNPSGTAQPGRYIQKTGRYDE
jgi:hypothetical protein